jgi:hypothetical protein
MLDANERWLHSRCQECQAEVMMLRWRRCRSFQNTFLTASAKLRTLLQSQAEYVFGRDAWIHSRQGDHEALPSARRSTAGPCTPCASFNLVGS